jgi:hypothetical protein
VSYRKIYFTNFGVSFAVFYGETVLGQAIHCYIRKQTLETVKKSIRPNELEIEKKNTKGVIYESR